MEIIDPIPGDEASISFNPFPDSQQEHKEYPVRNEKNVKLDATDLFSLFTADIIKKDVPFIR